MNVDLSSALQIRFNESTTTALKMLARSLDNLPEQIKAEVIALAINKSDTAQRFVMTLLIRDTGQRLVVESDVPAPKGSVLTLQRQGETLQWQPASSIQQLKALVHLQLAALQARQTPLMDTLQELQNWQQHLQTQTQLTRPAKQQLALINQLLSHPNLAVPTSPKQMATVVQHAVLNSGAFLEARLGQGDLVNAKMTDQKLMLMRLFRMLQQAPPAKMTNSKAASPQPLDNLFFSTKAALPHSYTLSNRPLHYEGAQSMTATLLSLKQAGLSAYLLNRETPRAIALASQGTRISTLAASGLGHTKHIHQDATTLASTLAAIRPSPTSLISLATKATWQFSALAKFEGAFQNTMHSNLTSNVAQPSNSANNPAEQPTRENQSLLHLLTTKTSSNAPSALSPRASTQTVFLGTSPVQPMNPQPDGLYSLSLMSHLPQSTSPNATKQPISSAPNDKLIATIITTSKTTGTIEALGLAAGALLTRSGALPNRSDAFLLVNLIGSLQKPLVAKHVFIPSAQPIMELDTLISPQVNLYNSRHPTEVAGLWLPMSQLITSNNKRPEDGIDRLMRHVFGGIARIQSMQMEAVGITRDGQGNSAPAAQWQMEIPLPMGDRWQQAQLTLYREDEESSRNSSEQEQQTRWGMRLCFELPPYGTLTADANLCGHRLQARMWTDGAELQRRAESHMGELLQRFREAGLFIEEIPCHQAVAPPLKGKRHFEVETAS